MAEPKELQVLPDIYEREGIAPPERKYQRWSVTVSSEPQYGNIETTFATQRHTCAVCGSTDTVCIHEKYSGSKEPCKSTELLCHTCSNYTVYFWEGW